MEPVEPGKYGRDWRVLPFQPIMNSNAMHMLIRYFDGRLQEAMLLSTRGNLIRLALRGCEDAAQFTLHEGQWLSESNDAVEIECLRSNMAAAAVPVC